MNNSNFDASAAGQSGKGIFGLPFSVDAAALVVYPVPWEVTVSYRVGTARGPEAVLKASPQLDLHDLCYGEVWERGIAMVEISGKLEMLNDWMRPKAEQVIRFLEEGGEAAGNAMIAELVAEVNDACETMCETVEREVAALLEKGKHVILLGGDHSTPLGFLRCLADRYEEFGILQLDAHQDLRIAYEGFKYSHASIMHNALELPSVKRLVQVGVRDVSGGGMRRVKSSEGRIEMFSMPDLRRRQFGGEKWRDICEKIVEVLPEKVYVSFDIDGLDPAMCPNTGTPVPDGLQFEEALFLVDMLVSSGREIIGADLVEVAPGPDGDEWDGNVGARVLYRLAGALLDSQV